MLTKARGVAEHRMRGGEMLPMLVVGWRASAVRGEEAGHFRKVVGVSIVVVGSPCSVTDILTVDSQMA